MTRISEITDTVPVKEEQGLEERSTELKGALDNSNDRISEKPWEGEKLRNYICKDKKKNK